MEGLSDVMSMSSNEETELKLVFVGILGVKEVVDADWDFLVIVSL